MMKFSAAARIANPVTNVLTQKFTAEVEPTLEANPRCTLTRASRRLQKHATAAPLALSRN
jgi:hypothetical protein